MSLWFSCHGGARPPSSSSKEQQLQQSDRKHDEEESASSSKPAASKREVKLPGLTRQLGRTGRLLIDSRTGEEDEKKGRDTALILAVREGLPEVRVAWLYRKGMPWSLKGSGSGRHLRWWCDVLPSLQMARVLLEHGARPNLLNGEGLTALFLAVKSDDEVS